ncbi:hypothetical protein H2200_011105 [Cladophialophora chaetospira]|uniref:Uncharacterized protein n=1 Tax=Cladophialophora chaetospira TaxID=386627 RepID=A0AA38X008_9EURO|nr:hypothetical protein H2200_011105 [Cladophialophora chaetospira]
MQGLRRNAPQKAAIDHFLARDTVQMWAGWTSNKTNQSHHRSSSQTCCPLNLDSLNHFCGTQHSIAQRCVTNFGTFIDDSNQSPTNIGALLLMSVVVQSMSPRRVLPEQSVGSENEHKQRQPDEQVDDPTFSASTKLGVLAACALGIGLACILASIGFLWFLWLAGDDNAIWRDILVRNWVTRAIALSSIVIRQAIAFQASVVTAMLAALALERMGVLLFNLASVSMTRNANGGPYLLFWWVWKAFVSHPKRWKISWLPLLTTILVLTTTLIQLTSFSLLSDVALVTVRGNKGIKLLPTTFKYGENGTIPILTHGSTWSQPIQSYVSFAEYHEEAPSGLGDGIDDTGLTLRAFLPLADQQSRSMIASWEGIATVLDARVVCLRPQLIEPRVHYADEALAITGAFELNLSNPSTLGFEYVPQVPGSLSKGPTSFGCILPLSAETNTPNYHANTADQAARSADLPWRLVICQPTGFQSDTSYILQSQFSTSSQIVRTPQDANYAFGNAYLMVNVSSGLEKDWAGTISGEDANLGIFRGDGTPPLAYSVHGHNNEWYDLLWSKDGLLNLSISVCYTAFDAADLYVRLESSTNHSDLSPEWNRSTQSFDYSAVRFQLGQELNGSVTYSDDLRSRNIMSLAKRESWIPEPDYGDYVVPSNRVTQTSWITDYANMAGSLQSNAFDYGAGANYTSIMWQAYAMPGLWDSTISYSFADASLLGLVQEILQFGGSLAFVMQSIVTSLAELGYYQQLRQLNAESQVESSHYFLVSAPTRKRGIIAVTVVVAVHILTTLLLVLPVFLSLTSISALGNAWQALAQVHDDQKTKAILEKAYLATDKQAEKAAYESGAASKEDLKKRRRAMKREIVGIKLSPDHSQPRVVNLFATSPNSFDDVESGDAGRSSPVEATGGGHNDEAATEQAHVENQEAGQGEHTGLLQQEVRPA